MGFFQRKPPQEAPAAGTGPREKKSRCRFVSGPDVDQQYDVILSPNQGRRSDTSTRDELGRLPESVSVCDA